MSQTPLRALVTPPSPGRPRPTRDRLVSFTNEVGDGLDRPTPLLPIASAPGSTVADRAVLVRLDGPMAGEPISVPKAGLRIGRSGEAALVIDDDDVSRIHGTIHYEPDVGYTLWDLGSRNGTSIGGVAVTRHLLQDGEVIRFGPRSSLRFAMIDAREEALRQHLFQSSTCDLLTGAFNRRHFEDRLRTEIAFAARHNTDLSLLLFDLDYFKKVNDTLGHPAGDALLKEVAGIAMARLRTEDIFARWGGEEFVVLLRNVDLPSAGRAAERLRAAVQESSRATISIGCATLSDESPTGEDLVAVADRRLYAAKRGGRNRVEWSG